MMTNNVLTFSTLQDLSTSLAEELNTLIYTLRKDKINMAISGGSTPQVLFKILADKYVSEINWSLIHFYWVDERCVPPGHPESNYGAAKRILLDSLPIPPENINRIRGEEEPGSEAARYSEVVLRNLDNVNGFPSFNITLLGIGDDGHTASIFPDQMHLINSSEIYVTSVHPTTSQSRITMTGTVMNNSQNTYVLVNGKSKAGMMKEILNKEPGATVYPAGYIKPVNKKLYWYLDYDAAKLL